MVRPRIGAIELPPESGWRTSTFGSERPARPRTKAPGVFGVAA